MVDHSSIIPFRVTDGLQKLGADINIARRRRRLSVADICDRANLSPKTYQRIEKGEPSVAMSAYAMVLFVLDLDQGLRDLASPSADDAGFASEAEHLPQRIAKPRKRENPSGSTPPTISSW